MAECSCLLAMNVYITTPHVQDAASTVRGLLTVLGPALDYVLVVEVLYTVGTVLLKISLGFFYCRFVVLPWQRSSVIACASFYTLLGTAFAFVLLFQCGDPRHFFAMQVANKCLHDDVLQPLLYVVSAVNAVTDWALALFPVHALLRASRLPWPTKLGAAVLLALGAVGSISAVVRMAYVQDIGSKPDLFRAAIKVAIWSVAEVGLGIFAGSMATARPLFARVVERVTTIRGGTSERHDGSDPEVRLQTYVFGEDGKEKMTTTGGDSRV